MDELIKRLRGQLGPGPVPTYAEIADAVERLSCALDRVKQLVNLTNQEGWKDERHSDWTRGRLLAIVELALRGVDVSGSSTRSGE